MTADRCHRCPARPRADALVVVTLLLVAACRKAPQGSPSPDEAAPAPPVPAAAAPFSDVTAAWGIDFVHFNGASERRYLPETMGSGVALFDYDGDGLADVYLVNGASFADPRTPAPPGALYRNLGGGRFVDVTARAGLDEPFAGMGTAVGDLDGDGDLDLVVTAVGRDRLFLNRSDGSFEEAGARLGLGSPGFGSSVAFLDFDRDGRLDLCTGRYVTWSPATDVRCRPDGEHPSYCTPEVYDGDSNRLYRNLGGGRLADVTRRAGLFEPGGKTLGLVPVDQDRDGWPDLVAANDTVRNFLFVNRRDGTFEETGVESGVAFGASGAPRGGMGIDAADLSGDGLLDLVIGNFAQEMSALFRASGVGIFNDEAAQLGVGLPSLMTLAFGTLALDYDGDGRQDLLLLNGHIEPEIARFQPLQTYAQPAALFRNAGADGGLQPVADPGALAEPLVGRGLAAADLDLDGDPDLVATQNGRRAVVLRNDAPPHPWLRLRPVGTASNRTGYGTVVEIASDGTPIRRDLVSGRSYLSASEPVLTIGLGSVGRPRTLEVTWPSGRRQRFVRPPVRRTLVVVEPGS